MTQEFNLQRAIQERLEVALRERGHATILVAGKSGVGKSTLINTVFGEAELATTGVGRPITKDVREYSKPGFPISIVDTRGLEMQDFQVTLDALIEEIDRRKADSDPNKHIHCAWLCITEASSRIEDGELRLAQMLVARSIPLVVVITRSDTNSGMRDKALELIPSAKAAIRVRALKSIFDEGVELPPMGLEQLVDVTTSLIPDGQQTAFVAAQRVSVEHKKRRADKAVATAAAAAAGIALTPIPFSDAILIIPVQVGMLASINVIFGMETTASRLAMIVTSSVGALGAAAVGRSFVTSVLKLIPGLNVLVGGISAAVAAALTTSLGSLYVGVLVSLLEASKGEPPSDEDIATAFKARLANRAR